MNSKTRNEARTILEGCETLADADKGLFKLVESRAMRWGLFDGWSGRTRTLAGLIPMNELEPSPQVKKDYREGCEIGRELSMREVPS